MNRQEIRAKFQDIVISYRRDRSTASHVIADALIACLDLPKHAVDDEVWWLEDVRCEPFPVRIIGWLIEAEDDGSINKLSFIETAHNRTAVPESELYLTKEEAEAAK